VLYEQDGFFTLAQAAAVGVPKQTIAEMLRAGLVRRVRRAVYAITTNAPMPRLDERTYGAWLAMAGDELPWARREPTVVVSHASAARLQRLGVLPDDDAIWLTAAHRKTTTAGDIVVRTASLPSSDWQWLFDGRIAVTTPARTVVDLAIAGVGHDYVMRAARDAIAAGTQPEQIVQVLERRRRTARRSSVAWLEKAISQTMSPR